MVCNVGFLPGVLRFAQVLVALLPVASRGFPLFPVASRGLLAALLPVAFRGCGVPVASRGMLAALLSVASRDRGFPWLPMGCCPSSSRSSRSCGFP